MIDLLHKTSISVICPECRKPSYYNIYREGKNARPCLNCGVGLQFHTIIETVKETKLNSEVSVLKGEEKNENYKL